MIPKNRPMPVSRPGFALCGAARCSPFVHNMANARAIGVASACAIGWPATGCDAAWPGSQPQSRIGAVEERCASRSQVPGRIRHSRELVHAKGARRQARVGKNVLDLAGAPHFVRNGTALAEDDDRRLG